MSRGWVIVMSDRAHISLGTIGLMAATILSQMSEDDREDLFIRGCYKDYHDGSLTFEKKVLSKCARIAINLALEIESQLEEKL
jgi:hypothetical protein